MRVGLCMCVHAPRRRPANNSGTRPRRKGSRATKKKKKKKKKKKGEMSICSLSRIVQGDKKFRQVESNRNRHNSNQKLDKYTILCGRVRGASPPPKTLCNILLLPLQSTFSLFNIDCAAVRLCAFRFK